jgi:glycine/D-amino acid oxidase-like deaminating enzyme
MASYRARRLPRQRGVAAWNAILGPQPMRPELSGQHTADFVVVGAGFAGLSAARRLLQLQPGAKVCVIEAGRIAEGAAGRNSGFMIDLPHELTSEDYSGGGGDRALIDLNRQAIAFARAAVNDFDIKPAYFDECGKVNGAVSSAAHAHNISYAQHLSDLGEAHEHLDSAQMRALTGSNYYRSGVYTPGTVMLQPAGYIRGLAEGLAPHMQLFENSPVTALNRVGPDWQVESSMGSITAARVILANNGHLESFGFEKGRLMQLFLYASMTPELSQDALVRLGGQARWGITPSDPMGTTMRRIDTRQGGNRIITRTCATLRSGMETRASDLARAGRVHRQKFDDRFPQLAGLDMEYAWAGHLCLSMNSVSVMRELEPNLFSACVQNGLGTARGTLTGIGAAELACDRQSAITAHFGGEPAPTKLPPSPVRDFGANLVLRWKEWKADAE